MIAESIEFCFLTSRALLFEPFNQKFVKLGEKQLGISEREGEGS